MKHNNSTETFKVKKIYLTRVLKGSCSEQKPLDYYQKQIDLMAKEERKRPLVIESKDIKFLKALLDWIKDNYPQLFKEETSYGESIKDY